MIVLTSYYNRAFVGFSVVPAVFLVLHICVAEELISYFTWKIMYGHPARYKIYHPEHSDNSYISIGVAGINSHTY